MAQNITLMGASYQDVPKVELPKTGGGTAEFTDVTDTTATASDVASGKYFYDSTGTRTQGTSSGGSTTIEALSVTQNGTYTAPTGKAYSPVTVNVSGGGGASNVVQGTFTTGSSTSVEGTFTIPYTGSGYPIMLLVYIDGGVYNNGTGGNTTWYDSTTRYAIGEFLITKARTTTAPTYETSGADNYGVVALIYKNSSTVATTYSRTSTMTANSFTSSSTSATSTNTTAVRFKGNGTTVSYWIGYFTALNDYQYGLLKDTKYAYIAVYSS